MASAIGLDIGSSAVRAVQLSRGRGGAIVLERLGQVVLEPETVVDGTIREPFLVTETLQILWEQFGFKQRKVAIGVASPEVVVRPVDLPRIEPGEGFLPTLRLNATDFLPLPLEDVEFDYELVEEYDTEDGQPMMRLLLVAAAKEMVATTLDAVKAARLKPMVMDLGALAMIRSLRDAASAASFGPGDGHAIVNVGANLTSMVIHTNGTPRFVRTVALGGEDITESLAAAFGMDWESAETIKSVTPGASSPYTALLNERIAWVIDEIRNSLAYYRTLAGAVPVERVTMTGGSSLIPALPDRLSQALTVDVDHGRPFRGVTVGDVPLTPAELDAAQPFFAVAMGLALRVLG